VEILIENVRSLSDFQRVQITPLTFLVGENSSGKSAFLAATAAVLSPEFPLLGTLNKPPYQMGNFETIVTYKGGKAGRAKSFGLGCNGSFQNAPVEIFARFANRDSVPELLDLRLNTKHGNVELKFDGKAITGHITNLSRQGQVLDQEVPVNFPIEDSDSVNSEAIGTAIMNSALRNKSTLRGDQTWILSASSQLRNTFRQFRMKADSVAPLRSKPKRIYDSRTDEYDPEGDHVPFLLSKIWSTTATQSHMMIRSALTEFGKASGLFSALHPQRLGHKPGAPFKIQVTVSGPAANLTDVGYGVSQSLPIVVQSIMESHDRCLLLQQPEVHLHPKAQAALGTFFAKLVATTNRHFIIETHSDYLIDRVRTEIGKGLIAPEKVSILFFDKPKIETTIHSLKFDRQGNVIAAPPQYRAFFLEEEIDLFNRANHVPDNRQQSS
jgi:energy-coupling factor transporter ATP-binding protein EcfA2